MARRLTGWRPGATDRRRGAGGPGGRAHARATSWSSRPGRSSPATATSIEGIASVDESAITGESAPVIRESGGDRQRGHRRHQGALRPDRRADHPEAGRELHRPDDRPGRGRQPAEDPERDRAEHPARRADDHLPAGRGRRCSRWRSTPRRSRPRPRTPRRSTANGVTGIVLVSLLVCLIPTTIGALLSAIGIAGMDRLVQRNVLAMSGRAVEAAGDVNTLLLDKTGTITLGNRQAARVPARRRRRRRASWPTPRSCPAWPTRPRRAARSWCSPSSSTACGNASPASMPHATFVPFTAQTRMSGVDLTENGRRGRSARARPPR